MRNKLVSIVGMVVVLSMVLSACGTPAATPVPPTAAPAAAATTAPAAAPAPTTAPAPAQPAAKAGLTAAQPLKMLFVPSGQAEKILAGGGELDKMLAEKGVYTASSVATSYAAAIEAICSGQVDIAWLAPLSYVLASDKCGAEVIFTALRFGSTTYNGQIIVRSDSGIEKVSDLKGKKFAYTDPASTSGYLYPAGLLLKEGVNPATDLAEAVFAGSHNAAAIAVYQGSVDAAATFVDVRTQLEKDFPDVMSKTKVLTLTDDIPNDTISVGPNMDPEVKAKFRQAMLDVMGTEAGKKVAYDIYEWDGIGESSDALFDPVRQVAAAMGIELQNWKGVSAPYLVGMVTDMGGIDDKSFNATAWLGVERAMKGLLVSGKYLESQQQSDYAKNLQQFVDEKLDLIVTVGFLLGVDTAKSAEANPGLNYAIVDYAFPDCWPGATVGKDCGSDVPIDNVLGLTFQTDQAGFMAGYLAAGMTKTGKIGTFGGIKLPTVTIFMKGLEAGVKHYNAIKGTSVEVLGWETAKDEGLFTGNFESTDDGRKFAESLMDEGADIIMPVAGPVGLGTAAACQQRGCMMIGVDYDWYISAPEYKEIFLTSVQKKMDQAVYDAIRAVTRGSFKGGTYVGTLANNGVDIAPYHDFDAQVSEELKAEIVQLKKDLIAGTITVDGALK